MKSKFENPADDFSPLSLSVPQADWPLRRVFGGFRVVTDSSAEAFSAQLHPGVTRKLTLVNDAPEGAQGLKLHIPVGFGFGKCADIKVPGAGKSGARKSGAGNS